MRKRALLLSAVISVVVLFILIFAYSKLNETHERALANIQERTKLLTMLNDIRDDLLDSYKDLNNFLLVPEKLEYKGYIKKSISDAIQVSTQLASKMSDIEYNQSISVNNLKDQLKKLESDIHNLFTVRLDSAQLYPALAVAAEYMRPNRVKMNNILGVISNEMQIEDTIQRSPVIYERFIKTRFLWNKMLSNFRIYLANRTGSFDQALMPRQERGITATYVEFRISLIELLAIGERQQLGFESTYAVKDMKPASEKWFAGFNKIKIINNSDNWRLDAQIMKERIAPKIDSVVGLLYTLESVITLSASDDFERFAKLSRSQNRLLWLVAAMGLAFIIIIILSLDRFIFKPITLVVSALKAEALGKKGEVIPSANSKEAYDLIAAFSEMSRQVHLRQTELEYRALHDDLTSLPNRTLLLDRMEHDISTAKREGHDLCLLILDLDQFKEVNDTLGHAIGDQLLIELGSRLTHVLRDVDTIARFGGDEFAILLPHTTEPQAKLIAKKIIDTLKHVMLIEGVELYITASIGIACYPSHSQDGNDLLRLADIAMYVAKRNKTGYEVYNSELDEHSLMRLSLTNDLRDALHNNSLEVYYQPVFNVKKNEIIGFEALCRWFHTELGSIPPDNFIALAEQAGLINDLTYWVLDQSVNQLMQWHKINDELSIAVNISVYSFRDKTFVSRIREVLKKYSFSYRKLTLEITEGAMMENPLQAVEVLSELQSMGINLAVDDFGTGYSSMAYLKNLPVNDLKIDKSFVIGLDTDSSDEAIVRSTIDLAHNLGLRVIAEGVETQHAWNLLSDLDCDVAQGFFMGKPVSSDDIDEIISRD